MRLRPYLIQRHHLERLSVHTVPRVEYDLLLKQLRYPLLWVRDDYYDCWLPAEVDESFIEWIQGLPQDFAEPPPARLDQLNKYGLLEPTRLSVDQIRAEMSDKGYAIIPQMIHTKYARGLFGPYYHRNNHLHDRWKDLPGIIRTSVNNMPLMRLLHMGTETLVNKILPERVKASYSFASAYESGSTLPAHTDRPQCVYNITLLLGGTPPKIPLTAWPFYIQGRKGVGTIRLRAGDGVIYSGTRDRHWRDAMPAELHSVLGVFLHYVPHDFQGSLD